MSGQWEVVGKGKKDKHNNKKLSKSEKKKFVDNAPKVEDLLPLSQVKTLYSALDSNKDAANKQAEKALKTKENEAKKAQKKQPQQQDKKKDKEPVKEKPPKNLESAVALLTVENVSLVIETGKLRFKEAPLIWLKSLASFLNIKLPVEHRETTFSSKSFDHPLCLLPSDVRNLIKKELKDVPDSAIQTFYSFCLTSLANDMTKGTPICGYKMLLQLLAIQYPSITVTNLDKSITLRDSYQNRQAIGLSILWALGQGGFKDISIGLKVWEEVMFPLLGMRHYTRYVLDYLKHVLARHSTSKALGPEQFFSLIDTIYSWELRIPTPVAVELKLFTKQLREIACNQSEKRLHLNFESLLERIPYAPNLLREELLKFAVTCLINDANTLPIWRQLYRDNLVQSALILKALNSDWASAKKKFPEIVKAVSAFKSINESMVKSNQKAAGLQDCTRLCEVLLNKKMTTRKSGFPMCKCAFFVLLATVISVSFFIANEINTHGSLKASPTGRKLKEIGALEITETVVQKTKSYYNQTYKWASKNVPVYYEKASEISKPYLKVIGEYLLIAYKHVKQSMEAIYTFIIAKLPFVEKWVNAYAPGLPSKELAFQAWDMASHYSKIALQLVLKYGVEFINLTVHVFALLYAWLQKNVLVGNFSSENLQKYAVEGLNATYTFAAQTYFWVQDKLITLYT